jgi:large subunit ribosomal protein L9
MPIELILLNNVQDLGRIGETVRVADGYARNYLIPRGLASKASPGALRQLTARKQQLEELYAAEVDGARTLATTVETNSVSIPVQAGEDGKLYGSVTAAQIVDAFAEMDVILERKQVVLAEPIRELGVYNVEIKLHDEVSVFAKVWVVKS